MCYIQTQTWWQHGFLQLWIDKIEHWAIKFNNVHKTVHLKLLFCSLGQLRTVAECSVNEEEEEHFCIDQGPLHDVSSLLNHFWTDKS